jgi:hypothetical protein
MFGAEPQEPWSEEERREFKAYISARTKSYAIRALKAATALAINIACTVPFLAGHRFHIYWHTARFLVWSAMALFLWLIVEIGFMWSSWQSARETKRGN